MWPSEVRLNPVLQLPAVDATTEDGSNCKSQKTLPTLESDIEDLTGKSLMTCQELGTYEYLRSVAYGRHSGHDRRIVRQAVAWNRGIVITDVALPRDLHST